MDAEYILDRYVHNRDPSLFQTNAVETDTPIGSTKYHSCSISRLRLCYGARNMSNDNACLYQRFLDNKRLDITAAVRLNGDLTENMLYHQPDNIQQEFLKEKTVLGSDKTLTYLFVAVAVVFCMASVSLILTLILIVKRNNFVYYTAAKDFGNSYPIDER
jgi:hypothetical protein